MRFHPRFNVKPLGQPICMDFVMENFNVVLSSFLSEVWNTYSWRNQLSNTLVFWSFTSGSPIIKTFFNPGKSWKTPRADIWCTVPGQVALRAVFVSIGTLGLTRFDGWANSSVFMYDERIVPGHVWIPHRSSGRANASVWHRFSRPIEWVDSWDLEFVKNKNLRIAG